MAHNSKTLSAGRSRVEQATVPITSDADILLARQRARELASEAEFTALESTFIATAISELGRNILQHAGQGEVSIKIDQQEDGTALIVMARDNGPGIHNLKRALKDGFSTSGGLGLGLPGVRRLMDEFAIVSHQNFGTTVIAKKWARGCTSSRLGRTARASFKRRDGAAAGKLAAVGSLSR
jgi:anti-sigma regulatory factor (Ser/Thr protein kinase)